MATEFGKPGWVDTVLDRIGTALTQANLIAADLVFVYEGDIGDLLAKPPADKFLVIAPMRLPVIAGTVAGGGKTQTVFAGEFRVEVVQRVGGDREFRSYRQLVRSGGLATFAKSVIDVLQLNSLTVAAGGGALETPLVEPMRLISSEFNPRMPQPGWAWCRTLWSAKFRTSFGS